MRKIANEKKETARIMYMAGEQQKIIADKIGTTCQTITRWVAEGAWDKIRAAKNVSRPELVNKILGTIDKLTESVLASESKEELDGLGDKLAKLGAVIEKLDKKASVVDIIEVFMAFGRWLQTRAEYDSAVTAALMADINKLQDAYITETINNKGR